MGPRLQVSPAKVHLASLLHGTRIDALLLEVLRRAGPYVRVVNYHGTPSWHRDAFARQLEWYARHFVPASRDDLEGLLSGLPWTGARPGLVFTFDDGLRDNAHVAAPLLEAFGFQGWFFVPTAFVDTPPDQQAAFARDHAIARGEPGPDGRLALSWEELRDLATRHVVGCHTATHHRLAASTDPDRMRQEIEASRKRLEAGLGRPVDAFCWVGGEEWAYSAEAAALIRACGYRYGFMTNHAPLRPGTDPLHLQRSNVEAGWPVSLAAFQVSGILDLLYTPKRRRVDRLTGRHMEGR